MFRAPRVLSAALAAVAGLSACVGTVGGDAPSPPGGTPPAGAGPVDQGVPDHVPLRRLTRAQYDNTVRDLLGLTGTPAAGFGIDEQEGGFNANSRAPLKELQIEKYQQAAEDLAAKAVANLARLTSCAPPARTDTACVDELLATFGKRAYRRPLTAEEIDRYRQLYQAAKTSGADFAAGVSLLVSTMLQSPHFLYRPELGEGRPGRDGVQLTPYETASRLSYFFLDSMPDDELFAAADGNRLATTEQIGAQARRLLGRPQARDMIASFHEQWLQVDDLPTVEKNPQVYPAFSPELRASMLAELDELADQVTRQGDGKLETLLSASFSYLSGPLYALYGVTGSGATPKKVELPAGQRAGLFTLAAVMTRHSHADQSSLVGRGAVVSDRLLCVTPPSPPDDVDATVPKPDPNVPTRQRFESHRANPRCAACHQLMDPLGIPFEIYDGVGRFRATDGGKPVDASSELKGTDNDGPVANAVELMGRLSRSTQVRRCLTRQWFRYVFGRMDTATDAPAIDAALSAFAGSGHEIPALMIALSTTNAFRFRRPVDLP
jgi:hypothetical protein